MINREAIKTIKEISCTFRILLITGHSGVGKTTLLSKYKPKGMKYVTLEDVDERKLAKTNPKKFLEKYPWPLFIEEVQYAPELFSYIKMEVDKYKKRGMYWFTGSQYFPLMKNVTESLAGRMGIVELNSLTYSEIVGNDKKVLFEPVDIREQDYISEDELFKLIFKGGMPELYDKNIDTEIFFKSFIDRYISRDVVEQLGDNFDKKLFKDFLICIAKENGKMIDYSYLSKSVGISENIARSWVDVLETSRIIYLLSPMEYINHNYYKIVFMDSGLCAYLAGWKTPKELQESSVSELFLKCFVISEIVKSCDANGMRANIMYYRNKEKKKIDLLFFKNNTYYPFEIKKTTSPNEGMLSNFKYFEASGKQIGRGGVICFAEHYRKLNDKYDVIPIASVINPSE